IDHGGNSLRGALQRLQTVAAQRREAFGICIAGKDIGVKQIRQIGFYSADTCPHSRQWRTHFVGNGGTQRRHQRHFFLVYSLLAQLYAPEVVDALQCNLQLSMEEVEKSQALRVECLLGTSQQKKTQQTLLSMSWQRQRCSELPHLFRYLWRT